MKCFSPNRCHHLVKTFWTGIDGWADQQLSDGTVVWTAPTGRTYKTLPGSRLFFPTWNTTTAELPKAAAPANIPGRGLMMPKRQRTRTAERAQHIQHERKLNAAQRATWGRQAAKPTRPPTDRTPEILGNQTRPHQRRRRPATLLRRSRVSTNRYVVRVEATAKMCHSPGTPLSS